MFRAAIAVVASFSFVLLMPRTADACRCKMPSTPAAYKRAQAVVVAKVISIDQRENDGQAAVLSVSQAWKLDLPARLTVLGGGRVCGHFFEADQEYVLYLSVNQDGTYTTANCVGNKFMNNPKLPRNYAEAAKADIAWLKRYGKAGKVD